MTGNSFLNAFMPMLPAYLFAGVVVAGWVFVARAWIRRMNTSRHQVERPRQALQQARDALAQVIADSAVFGDARSQALSAYESVGDALKKEKD